MARQSYKNHLRTIGRKPIHGTLRTVKQPGDKVLFAGGVVQVVGEQASA